MSTFLLKSQKIFFYYKVIILVQTVQPMNVLDYAAGDHYMIDVVKL